MQDTHCFKILKKTVLFRKLMSSLIVASFLFSLIATPAGAQVFSRPKSSIGLTAGFQPPVILGLKVHPENPLLFDFIVDRGQSNLSQSELKTETEKLVKYFLAALTIPDKEVWVNLSPYEKDRIIPDVLGQTTMGKTMLEQDYILKQLASSLTNPDEKLGQEFWAKVKAQTQDQLGTRDIPLSTFNKVWIVPAKAEVLESNGIVVVQEKRLKLMMDEDYVALGKPQVDEATHAKNSNSISSRVFKDTILPNIEKELNEGKNFSEVRQVYHSVILATWYKKALKESLLGQVYADKGKVAGVENDDKDMKQKIYEQYLAAFEKGIYNIIKEEKDSAGDLIPRKYFSGGETFYDVPLSIRASSSVQLQNHISAVSSGLVNVSVQLAVDIKERSLLSAAASSGLTQSASIKVNDILTRIKADEQKYPEKKKRDILSGKSFMDFLNELSIADFSSSTAPEDRYVSFDPTSNNYADNAIFADLAREFAILTGMKQRVIAGQKVYVYLKADGQRANYDEFVRQLQVNNILSQGDLPFAASSGVESLKAIVAGLGTQILDLSPDARNQYNAFIDEYNVVINPIAENNQEISDAIGSATRLRAALKSTFDQMAQGSRAEFVRTDFAVILRRTKGFIDSSLSSSSAITPESATLEPMADVNTFTKGGIDFDPTNMNLQIKRDGKGVPLPLPQQNLEFIHIDGLFPVIINIVPINAQNLPIFLGLTPSEPAREPELASHRAS